MAGRTRGSRSPVVDAARSSLALSCLVIVVGILVGLLAYFVYGFARGVQRLIPMTARLVDGAADAIVNISRMLDEVKTNITCSL